MVRLRLKADCVSWRVLVSLFLLTMVLQAQPAPEGRPAPIIGPDVISFGDLQPVTLIYQPLATVQPQNGLPAPGGAVFDGPDPGLNANIIGGSDCPNNYRKDPAGICRLEFGYGPNPFSPIIPHTFKGSLQFYMGLQVGNLNLNGGSGPRRRFPLRLRGKLRHRNLNRGLRPLAKNSDDDDD